MSTPWGWSHVILSTYGSWLYGDPRGFRTRHHREHVEGDYKNPPPPGKYAEKERRSRQFLRQAPVVIEPALRELVGRAILDKLRRLGGVVVCITVAGQHVHLLAKMPIGSYRDWMGTVKKHAWFTLRERGWIGRLWAKRCKTVPVRDRAHQMNVFRYIVRHVEERAWVWKWGDPISDPTPASDPTPTGGNPWAQAHNSEDQS